MKTLPTIRSRVIRISTLLCVGMLLVAGVTARAAGRLGPQNNVPRPAPPPPAARRLTPNNGPAGNAGVPVRGAHLGQWMQQHGNLNPTEQQRALQNEPGFRSLPPGTQANVMNRLNRLNTLPEQQRERVIQRNEFMEKMTPQQRGSVRGAMGQLSALQVDRRRAVSRSFRELRNLPPEQQNAILNSPQYRQQFSDEERGTLGNLLAVAPLLPPTQ